MVPKKLHYCWFGGAEMPKLSMRCEESWNVYAPDYEVFRWSENNTFDIESKYFRKCLKDEMWAFASDYIRLFRLYEYGGVYLDTDMELIRPLDTLLSEFEHSEAIFCEERNGIISAGFIYAKKESPIIGEALRFYDNNLKVGEYVNIPKILSAVYRSRAKELDVKVLPKECFYPYNPYDKGDVGQLMYSDVKSNTFGIHHWQKSWKKSLKHRIYERFFSHI
ncbi:MAG: polysaccharide biosynthesis protein [Halomonas sp.]|nr:polysaccharide biosynthesis protein [Halomonas sp.]|tara:strand:- start:3413 stop:4075 length:663 start_codon:yes stop_codon:yes gene_type:complete